MNWSCNPVARGSICTASVCAELVLDYYVMHLFGQQLAEIFKIIRHLTENNNMNKRFMAVMQVNLC